MRPAALSVCASIAGVTLAALLVLRTDVVLKPLPKPVDVTVNVDTYMARGAVYSDAEPAVRAVRRSFSGGMSKPADPWMIAQVSAVRIEAGYSRREQGGARLMDRWIGREEIWWRESMPAAYDGRTAWTPMAEVELDKQRTIAMGLMTADPRMTGLKMGVAPGALPRTWVNWRMVGSDASTVVAWHSGLLAAFLGWLEICARARPRRVKAGMCPTCRYTLAGADLERCSECGCGLTLHERSVLAAMNPGPGRGASAALA